MPASEPLLEATALMVTGSPDFTWFGVMVRLLIEKIGLLTYCGYCGAIVLGAGNCPGGANVPGAWNCSGVANAPGPWVGIGVGYPICGLVGPEPGIGAGNCVAACVDGCPCLP